ncbi:MAG: hypothetical protein JNL67_01195 [Planctomycetaceae bacterium]|nr:hypothetical protein [Planctomycetaceae bacterium]
MLILYEDPRNNYLRGILGQAIPQITQRARFMHNLKRLIVALLVASVFGQFAADVNAQIPSFPDGFNSHPHRIPGRSDNFDIPKTPNFPDGFGAPPRGISGNLFDSEEYEFTCSNCDRVIATGRTKNAADHIDRCKYCGVRFHSEVVFENENQPRNGQPVHQGGNQAAPGFRTGDQGAFGELIFVAIAGFVLSLMLIAGGIVFYVVKAATKSSRRYGAYGQAPYGPSSQNYPPPESWNNPYNRG